MRNTSRSLAPAPPKPEDKALLRSVTNALAVLEAFSLERPELGVTELSQALGLGKSTVHRLLTSLSARGYVRKTLRTEKYCLGLKVFEIGSLVAGQLTLRESAAPYLQQLMTASRETVHLGVLAGWEVVYIDKIESTQALQIYSRIGRRAPLHATALGKALLACLPDEEIDRFLRRRLKAHTPLTLTDPPRMRREIQRIRVAGYAVDNEEFEAGLKCIAAPLRDHTGAAVASMGVACPAVRLPEERLGALVPLVREAARGASLALGFRGSRA